MDVPIQRWVKAANPHRGLRDVRESIPAGFELGRTLFRLLLLDWIGLFKKSNSLETIAFVRKFLEGKSQTPSAPPHPHLHIKLVTCESMANRQIRVPSAPSETLPVPWNARRQHPSPLQGTDLVQRTSLKLEENRTTLFAQLLPPPTALEPDN